MNTFLGEQFCRRERLANQHAVHDQGDVIAVAQERGLADLEVIVRVMHNGHRQATDAYKHGPLSARSHLNGLCCLDRICGHDHCHVGDGPQPGHIFDRVVRRA